MAEKEKTIVEKLAIIDKKKIWFNSDVEFLNRLHAAGLPRHECMTVEMYLHGKNTAAIKRVLLFTDPYFTEIVDNIYVFLKEFKQATKRRSIAQFFGFS